MNAVELPQTPRQLRRMLARRLGIGALLVGTLAGGLAYRIESYRVEQRTLAHAVAGVRHFESPAMQLAARGAKTGHPEIAQMLTEEFVGIRVFGRDLEVLFEAWQPLPEPLVEAARRQSHAWPEAGGSHSRRIAVDGDELVQVVLPVAAGDGRLAGYVEGISRVTSSALQARQQQIRSVALAAALSVFAAALLLYPLMLAMLHRAGSLSSRLLEANLSLLRALGNAIAKRDADTDAHNYRVTCYAVALAESLGVARETIADLVLGAFLHDIGKIGIPDRILLKAGKLSDDEFRVMQSHVLLGIEIVAGNRWLAGAEKTIRHHHERFDGTGYPDGLAGEAIPLAARIFALVDTFDALTSVRPYKPALSLEETLAIMEREACSHFDPAIHAAFRRLAPSLYDRGRSWSDADWHSTLRSVLGRYFKMEAAPEGAAGTA